MKKLIMILFCSLALVAAKAQTTATDLKKMSVDQKATLMTDSLKAMLSLNATQYKDIHALVLEGVTKAAPIMQSNGSRMSKGMKLKSIFETQEKKVKVLLTSQQQQLYEVKKKDLIAYYRSRYQQSYPAY